MISKRSGYLLFETMIVLFIVCGLLGCFIWTKPTPSDELTVFKREFARCYAAVRRQQLLSRQSFIIGSYSDGVFRVGPKTVPLPPGWYITYHRLLCRPYYMQPGTLVFVNEKTGQRLQLVFQLGGGTYVFR